MCLVPRTPDEVLYKVNRRFAPGDALKEMIIIQKQFQVFHPRNSLQQAYRLLGLGPDDSRERRYYFRYLEQLKEVPSDIDDMNGHDRIVKARQDNLENKNPLPMFTQTHREFRVTVTIGNPLPYPNQDHMIISVPMIPPQPPASAKRAVSRRNGHNDPGDAA
jgi:hypothetical protein